MLDLDHGCVLELLCRDDRCELEGVHWRHKINEPAPKGRRIRSRRWQMEPWRLNCSDALRACVFASVSTTEPRNFATVLSLVENDYGSCCSRSVHRHLAQLRSERNIVRLDFPGNIHAYLKAGSRLIRDPDLVHEQVAMLYGEVA
jgi:hypothetical protein